ncbi:MAG TPA: AAA family ATPase [Bryobacteraceae bacterium]|nr:AAA family ATPase [Bryobacteraceae bacterium]
MDAVLFVGIQGAGKSTFYRERFFDTHVRISLDMLRTRTRERILFEACLRAQQPFVVDNTNVLASERAVYIVPARAAGFRVTGYFFVPDARGSIARNQAREGRQAIPVRGVLGTLKRLQPPRLEEGFHALYLVRALPERQFEIEPAS